MCMYNVFVSLCMCYVCTYMYSMYVHVCICIMYVCTCMYSICRVRVCMYICIHVYVYACIHNKVYVSLCMFYVYLHVSVMHQMYKTHTSGNDVNKERLNQSSLNTWKGYLYINPHRRSPCRPSGCLGQQKFLYVYMSIMCDVSTRLSSKGRSPINGANQTPIVRVPCMVTVLQLASVEVKEDSINTWIATD